MLLCCRTVQERVMYSVWARCEGIRTAGWTEETERETTRTEDSPDSEGFSSGRSRSLGCRQRGEWREGKREGQIPSKDEAASQDSVDLRLGQHPSLTAMVKNGNGQTRVLPTLLPERVIRRDER